MMTLFDEPLLPGLNPAQRDAVVHVRGPLLVLAGAGSGKTRVLTTRIARLVEVEGVDPSRILAVTFTNKAAGEMRDRIERLLGRTPSGMWIGTFHAIGARMLRLAPALVGRTPAFTIYDQDDSLAVVKRLMERHRIDTKQHAPRAIHAAISDAKNALVPPSEYEALAMDPFSKAAALVYRGLDEELRRANAVDFDDLLVLPVRMLQHHADQRSRYRRRFEFILVDEYQDTNRAQYQLIKLLAGADGDTARERSVAHHNVCVVGDDDQSIYGWRGADIRNILDFNKDFPDAVVVRLEENYRSAPPILAVANAVISANVTRMGKTLRATRSGGEPVTAVRTLDERDEADWVVQELLARRSQTPDLMLRDVAVLYRTNAQSRALEEALRRHALPYRLVGAVRFYDRREIRDLMSYLKLIANPSDDEAFRRAVAVPRRGLGETTIEQLGEIGRREGISMLAAAERPELLEGFRSATRQALSDFATLIGDFRERAVEAAVDELLRDLVEAIRYGEYLRAEGPESVERLENVRELVTGAAEQIVDDLGEVGLTPLDHFLQRATLVADIDSLDADSDGITLMTLHNAKGLEFPVVFITGLEDGLFPLARAYDERAMLEEERRLFYVGITRAQTKLYMTYAEERRRNGELLQSKPSSFLQEIPDSLLEKRQSVRVRSAGRAFMSGGSWRSVGSGAGRSLGTTRVSLDLSDAVAAAHMSPSARRPGSPVQRSPAFTDDEHVSQDAPVIAIGARVKHRKFGSGTIGEIAGAGRDVKVKIDFDDREVGRKTLVVAQANLERGDE